MPYSAAPNHETLFKQQYYVEKAIVDFLKASPQSLANVYPSRDPSAKLKPRVEVAFMLGQQGQQMKTVNGRNIPVAFDFGLILTVVTDRNDNTQDHDDLVAKLQWYMSAAKGALTDTNMPYHQIVALQYGGFQQALGEDREEDITTVTFGGKIQIRNEAWPVPTP